MQIDTIWLLKNYRYLLSRYRFLQTLISTLEDRPVADEEIIESITYLKGCFDAQPRSKANSSRTEYAAVHLDAIRNEQEATQAASRKQWRAEFNTIKTLLQIHDAAISVLTEEEQALVEKHYNEHMSISSLENVPLTEGGYAKSRSTLKRMLKGIEQKIAGVISLNAE